MSSLKKQILLFFISYLFFGIPLQAQTPFVKTDVFQTHYFLENKGQFNGHYSQLPPVNFVLEEAFVDYILTKNGIAYVYQNLRPKDTSIHHFNLDQHPISEEQEKAFSMVIDTTVVLQEFTNYNPNYQIVSEYKSAHFFSFLEPQFKIHGYKQITYKNFYNHIDLIFTLAPVGKGIKYSFKVYPGGDISQIKFRYRNIPLNVQLSVQKSFAISANNEIPLTTKIINGNELSISSSSIKINETGLILKNSAGKLLSAIYSQSGNWLSFKFSPKLFPNEIENCKKLGFEIDPFVNIMINPWYAPLIMTEQVVKADYDAYGNIYYYGAAKGFNHKVSKYTQDGVLVWTMVGTLPNVYLRYNSGAFGTIKVDRCTGKIYCMPGGGPESFFRITTDCQYDHYWAKPLEPETLSYWDIDFIKKYKSMGFFCGHRDSNAAYYNVIDSFPIGVKTSVTKDTVIPLPKKTFLDRTRREFVNAVHDDYGVGFATLTQGQNIDPSAYQYQNVIIGIDSNFRSTIWEKKLGIYSFIVSKNCVVYPVRYNKNWLTLWYQHNRFNSLAVYDRNLFFYDGKHFAAYNKSNGTRICIDSFPWLKMATTSGIAVDSCNNVYMGADSARVFVYHFDGSKFNKVKVLQLLKDSANNRRVYDVAYNYDSHTLLVSGDSFAASINCETPCGNKIRLATSSLRSCGEPLWAKIINPDSTLTYTFEWRKPLNNNELIRTVTGRYKYSDTLSTLTPNSDYRLYIFVSPFCVGTFKTKNFKVRYSFDSTVDISICQADTFVHNGKKSFQAGVYIDSLKTYFGCDSIITYRVSIRSRSFVDSFAKICKGGSFLLSNKILRTSGVYSDTLINAVGCDSITTIHLTVMFDSVYQTVKLCRGDSFAINGHFYRTSGLYFDTFQSSKLCDSVVVTNLIVNHDSTYQSFTICQGDSVVIGPHAYKTSGLFLDTFTSSKFCDSVVYTDLTVHKTNSFKTNLVFCNVDSFPYRGIQHALPFTLNDTLTTWQGCDSIFTLSVNGHWIRANFDIDSSAFPEFRFLDKSTHSVSRTWDFGDNATASDTLVKHTFEKSFQGIKYNVRLIVRDSFGCEDTIQRWLWVQPMTDIFIPEGISPNGDGKHDELIFDGIWAFPKAEWTIFNRWGQIVFQSNAQNQRPWKGQCEAFGCNGDILPEGIYFIIFEYNDGKHSNITANIYLKR